MPTVVEKVGASVVVVLASTIDGRGAIEFDRKMAQQLESGTRLFAVDFSSVRLITSAGLRVLLMLRKRAGAEGGLVLCGLSERIGTLFDIAGLTSQFQMTATRDEALAHLASLHAGPPVAEAPSSSLGRLLLGLLGHSTPARERPADTSGPSHSVSGIAARAMDLLGRRSDSGRSRSLGD